MNTQDQVPDEEGDPLLDELVVAIEADLELIVNSRADDADPGTPDQWLDDPEEVQVEETDLRSLLSAAEALEPDRRHDPGDASSS
ncbi:hypothetical protein E0H75_21485 [Kribbella capetownensis]|uniref:Uncharacterized protein n=1 Tax=Kribbella capetownensis TaxID=1572659 RepID=A0A4R0JQL8_9ACTN|nr:hypothetical protein [Kribbella capetownensis]TCC49109.1 hypothetical protein E0H75_21485 [Kribbella capetownensis]